MDDLLGLELQLLMPQCTSRGRKGKLERRSQQEATRSGNDNAAAATKQNIQIQAPVPGEFRRASSTQRRLLFAGTSTLGTSSAPCQESATASSGKERPKSPLENDASIVAP